MSSYLPRPPKDRQGFKIGIICALSLEADMVEMVFDKRWKKDGISYGQAESDFNSYTPGVIVGHNVVLTYCSSMGSNGAAQVATALLSSFGGIKIILVVGICGAVPFYQYQDERQEIVLGDCLISTAVIQFDLGRRGPNGFAKKDGLDGLGRAGNQVRAMMAKLQTQTNRLELTENLRLHLQALQKADSKRTKHPGVKQDRLYESSYIHTHRTPAEVCHKCKIGLGICEQSCRDLGCEDQYLKSRASVKGSSEPRIHFGQFGSSNTVLKSGLERDALAKANNIIAFEMEGSGVWDMCSTVVIKAACDYADSHKNKIWQSYAAAVAAAGTKAFLQELELPLDQGLYMSTSIDPLKELINQADASIYQCNTSSERLKIERLSGETLPMETCYINLALVQRSDRTREVNERSSSSLSLEARLQLEADDPKGEISLGELFARRKLSNSIVGEPRRIYIRGRAGVGKTTLCKKIVYEFHHQRFGQGLFDRLLWLPLRQLTSKARDEYGWKDLIQDIYRLSDPKWKQVIDTFSVQLYKPSFLDRTLLLFDGLDEVSQGWTQNNRMHEFLEQVICTSPNVVITSRPQANSLAVGDFDLELETLGFTFDQVNLYLENCVRNPKVIANMKSFMNVRPLVQGLLRIPIQLDAFCCTWPSGEDSQLSNMSSSNIKDSMNSQKENITTVTLLYLSISFELCRKDIGRRERQDRFRSIGESEVNQLFANELRVLEGLAFCGMASDLITYSPKSQDMVLSYLLQDGIQLQTPYSSVLGRLSFLRSSYIEQDLGKRNYHFLHLTFQEFFAAKYFVRHWLNDTPLVYLLLGASGKRKSISTFRFLQTEKYNPRYNIFWRFVTGLIQVQAHESEYLSNHIQRKGIVIFFEQLLKDPIDLIGYGHHLLLMHCLSELSYSSEQDIRRVRHIVEEMLRDWMIKECNGRYESLRLLSAEDEYPESILRHCLQDERYLPSIKILQVLVRRSFLTRETLIDIAAFLDHTSALPVRILAMRIILENSETAPQELITYTIYKAIEMLDGGNDRLSVLRSSAILRDFKPALPVDVIPILFSMMVSEDEVKRYMIRQILAHQALPPEIRTAFIEMLKSKDYEKRISAAIILAYQSPPPQELATTLLAWLKNEHKDFAETLLSSHPGVVQKIATDLVEVLRDGEHRAKRSAAHVLESCDFLPEEIVTALLAMLSDRDHDVRSCAAKSLSSRLPLTQKVVGALLAALKDEDQHVRNRAAFALASGPSPPHEAVIVLLATIREKQEEALLRCSALHLLRGKEPLYQEVVAGLLTLLEDKDEHDVVQEAALSVLRNRSFLPQEIVNVLLRMLQDDGRKHATRQCAGEALYDQLSLPQEGISILLKLLGDEHETDDIRYHVSSILSRQSSLSQETVSTLITILENTNHEVYFPTVSIRAAQSLSYADINSIVPMLNGRARGMYNLLHHSSIYSHVTSLDEQTWQQLWSYWLGGSSDYDISCYELDDSLYLWVDMTLHQISADPEHTKQLLRVVSSTNAQKISAKL